MISFEKIGTVSFFIWLSCVHFCFSMFNPNPWADNNIQQPMPQPQQPMMPQGQGPIPQGMPQQPMPQPQQFGAVAGQSLRQKSIRQQQQLLPGPPAGIFDAPPGDQVKFGATAVFSDGRMYNFSPSGTKIVVHPNGQMWEKNEMGTFLHDGAGNALIRNSQNMMVPFNPAAMQMGGGVGNNVAAIPAQMPPTGQTFQQFQQPPPTVAGPFHSGFTMVGGGGQQGSGNGNTLRNLSMKAHTGHTSRKSISSGRQTHQQGTHVIYNGEPAYIYKAKKSGNGMLQTDGTSKIGETTLRRVSGSGGK